MKNRMPLPKEQTSFERLSAKQRVYETVKDWIIEGQFKPDEKVSDIEIADYFKVSRTPVREALQLLEAQKLVKSYPGKATLVTDLETDNIEKWYHEKQDQNHHDHFTDDFECLFIIESAQHAGPSEQNHPAHPVNLRR